MTFLAASSPIEFPQCLSAWSTTVAWEEVLLPAFELCLGSNEDDPGNCTLVPTRPWFTHLPRFWHKHEWSYGTRHVLFRSYEKILARCCICCLATTAADMEPLIAYRAAIPHQLTSLYHQQHDSHLSAAIWEDIFRISGRNMSRREFREDPRRHFDPEGLCCQLIPWAETYLPKSWLMREFRPPGGRAVKKREKNEPRHDILRVLFIDLQDHCR